MINDPSEALDARSLLPGKMRIEKLFEPELLDLTEATSNCSGDCCCAKAIQRGASEPTSVNPPKTTVLAAIQEQLGLKLEAQRSSAEVLVIDHVEKPDAN